MNLDVFWAFLLAVAIIVAVPGPNIILVMNDSIRYGFKKSLLTILGIKAGTMLLVCLSLIGLTALATLFSWVFITIKWLGVIYLLYLGLSQIIASFKETSVDRQQGVENGNLFLKGFLVSATNPKGLLFATAFFPQFVSETAPIVPQLIILFAGFFIVSCMIEMIYAFAGDSTGKMVENQRFKIITERLSGMVLIVFGLGLSLVGQES